VSEAGTVSPPSIAQPGASGARPRLGRPVVAFAVIACIALALPVVALVARAVADGSLQAVAGMPVVIDALVLSLLTTTASLVLTVIFGTPLALVLARRSFRGQAVVETIIDLPIVLPPSVAGLALLLLLGRRGLLGEPLAALGVQIPFTLIAVVIAQTFVSASFYIRSARTGFATVDHDLEDASRVDGATERRVFTAITVPLASTALAAGLVLSWARALGEFGATIMFAGAVQGRTQTLPIVVYGEFLGGDLDTAIAAAAILVIAAFGVLVAVRILRTGRVSDVRGIA
jgi:molybdate transport system permease protein